MRTTSFIALHCIFCIYRYNCRTWNSKNHYFSLFLTSRLR